MYYTVGVKCGELLLNCRSGMNVQKIYVRHRDVLTPCSICRDLSHGFTEYNGDTIFIAGELKIACTKCKTLAVYCVWWR